MNKQLIKKDHLQNIAEPFSSRSKYIPIMRIGSRVQQIIDMQEILKNQIYPGNVQDEADLNLVARLGSISEYRDEQKKNNIQGRGYFCRIIAEKLGLDESIRDLLHVAGLVQDIGKIGIPDEILLKPGKLTPEECDIMIPHVFGSRNPGRI